MSILKVENIQKYYGGRGAVTKAVDGLSFTVDKGDFLGVMGASGSGKTTLLNCVSTIDRVTSGHIYVDGEDITAMNAVKLAAFRRGNLGFIFQDFNLLDTLTGYENIALALSILRVPAGVIDGRVKEVAKILEISDVVGKYPYQLSGGEKQRVAAARAIITQPKLVLADEPTGALDSKSAKALLLSLKKLNEQMNSTILMVTHDAATASYCKRILFLKDGRVINELYRGEDTKKRFFERILDVVSMMGGEMDA